MRILKVVLAVLVAVITVATGFFVVAAVAAAYLAYILVRWALARFGGAPRPRRDARPAGDGVIDVSATEVKEDGGAGAPRDPS